MRDYPTFQEVLVIHTLLLEQYGGAQGVRDPGAIEAALFRPQSGYYEDIVEESAALMESLLINHPFVDGNKRIAAALFVCFLQKTGILLTKDGHKRIDDNALVALTLMIAVSKPSEKEIMIKVILNLLNFKWMLTLNKIFYPLFLSSDGQGTILTLSG